MTKPKVRTLQVNCPKVAVGMPCQQCGVSPDVAPLKDDPDVPHKEPYLEIGIPGEPGLRISLMWIPGAGWGTKA